MRLRKVIPVLLCIALVLGTMDFPMLTSAAESGKHSCGTDDCTVCTVADMINALPGKEDITINNAAAVVAQIHAIDRIKGNLSDDEYEELLELVNAGNDGSGYGMDVPTKYLEAVDAVTKLNAGGSLYIQKKYAVGDENLNWDASDATFQIERLDGDGSFAPLSVTLANASDSYLSAYGMYSEDADGWTNAYPLPAGKYKITETGYNAITEDGEELTTTATYTVDGVESTESAIVTVEAGEDSSVSVLNSLIGYIKTEYTKGGAIQVDNEEIDTEQQYTNGTTVSIEFVPAEGYVLHTKSAYSIDSYGELHEEIIEDFLVENPENPDLYYYRVNGRMLFKAVFVPETIKISAVKADEDGNPTETLLPGAVLQINRNNTWTSTEDAHTINLTDYKLDTNYVIQETTPPEGYFNSTKAGKAFRINSADGTITFDGQEIGDEGILLPHEMTSVQIDTYYIDEEGNENPLNDIKVQILDKKGYVFTEWDSNENNRIGEGLVCDEDYTIVAYDENGDYYCENNGEFTLNLSPEGTVKVDEEVYEDGIVKIMFNAYDKYDVSLIDQPITYGDDLYSFVDFDKTKFNGELITDEDVKKALLDKLSFTLKDEKDEVHTLADIENLPAGAYTLTVEAYPEQDEKISLSETTTILYIVPRTLSAVDFDVTPEDKEYDGKKTAVVSAKLKSSVPGADNNEELEIYISGKFNDENVVDGNFVNYTITNLSSTNYKLENESISGTVQASISPKTLTAEHFDVTVQDKEYDGKAGATFVVAIKEAFKEIIKDIVVSITGAFTDTNVGEDIDVEYTIDGLSGDYAGNYQIDENKKSGTAKGTITAKPIDSVAVTFDEPQAGKELPSTVSLDSINVEGTLTWKNGEETAKGEAAYNTEYTAVVELTPTSNYKFKDSTVVNANDDRITFDLNSEGKIVFELDTAVTQKATVTSFVPFDTIEKSNGISKDELIAALPDSVTLVTNDDNNTYTGAVAWDKTGFDRYSQEALHEQTIGITGIVTLPGNVEADTELVLEVSQMFRILQRQIPDQDGDGKPEPDKDGDGIYEGTKEGTPYLPDQDGDKKAEPDADKDGVFDGTDSDNTYIPDQDGDGKPEVDDDKDGVYDGTDSDNTYIPDQDGDSKPEPDTNGDNIYEGTKGEKDYIPDQDDDGKYEVDDDKDEIFDNEKDDKHYVPDGKGGFIPYFFTYEVSDKVLTWTLGGTKDLTFTVKADAEKFEGLLLKGVAIDKGNYSYISGSTIITLKASYLNTLTVGEYAMIADYVDGSGETSLKIVAAAVTPDDNDNGPETEPGGNDNEPGTEPGGNDNGPGTEPGGGNGQGTTDKQPGNSNQIDDDDKNELDDIDNEGIADKDAEDDDQNGTKEESASDEEESDGVDTGDNSSLYLWLVTALTAMAALGTSRLAWRKRNNE